MRKANRRGHDLIVSAHAGGLASAELFHGLSMIRQTEHRETMVEGTGSRHVVVDSTYTGKGNVRCVNMAAASAAPGLNCNELTGEFWWRSSGHNVRDEEAFDDLLDDVAGEIEVVSADGDRHIQPA